MEELWEELGMSDESDEFEMIVDEVMDESLDDGG